MGRGVTREIALLRAAAPRPPLPTCRFSPGAGMGRMVAVSVTPRGTATAGLLLMIAVAPPESGAGAPAVGALAGPANDGAAAGAAVDAGGCAARRTSPLPRRHDDRSVGSLGRMSSPPPPWTGAGAASGDGDRPDSSGEGSGTMTASGTFFSS